MAQCVPFHKQPLLFNLFACVLFCMLPPVMWCYNRCIPIASKKDITYQITIIYT